MHVDKASRTDAIQNNYFLQFNLKKTQQQQQQQEFYVYCCICHLFGTLFDDGAHILVGGGGGGGIVGGRLGSVGIMSDPDCDGDSRLGDLSLSFISIKIIIIIAVNFHDEYMYEVKKHNLPSFAQN